MVPLLLPGQTGGLDDRSPSGLVVTVMGTLAVPVHPFAAVPVTVYVVVTLGYAITTLPVVIDKLVEGLQIYVLAPLAVNVTLLPLQNAAEAGVTETVGLALMVTEAIAFTAAQPPDDGTVYVTVYVPAVLDDGVMAPVVLLIVSPAGALNVPPV